VRGVNPWPGAFALLDDAPIKIWRTALCKEAIRIYGDLPIIFSGGVSSNCYLQSHLSSQFGAHFAEPQFSADNAAGIALLCRERYETCHKTN